MFVCLEVDQADNRRCTVTDANYAHFAKKVACFVGMFLRSDFLADDDVTSTPCFYPDFEQGVEDAVLCLKDAMDGPWVLIDVISLVMPFYSGDVRVYVTCRDEECRVENVALPLCPIAPPRRALTQEEFKDMCDFGAESDRHYILGSVTRDWTLVYEHEIGSSLHTNAKATRNDTELGEVLADITSRGKLAAVFPPGRALGASE